MADLVAVRLPSSRAAAAAVSEAWMAGNAVAVLDPGAPAAVAADLLDHLRPSALVHTRPDDTSRITRLPDAVPVPDGTAAVVTTSGSTGTPRAIVLSDRALKASGWATIDRLGCRPVQGWLGVLPLHHVAGLQVLCRSALMDATPDVHDGFDVAAVAASPAPWWPLVPTMLRRLLADGVDLAGRGILLGGAAADPHDVAAARAAGATVTLSYGMTETCGGCVYDGVPLAGVEIAIADDGRIRIRGDVVADGERTPEGDVVPVTDADGWLTTGDLGTWVHGRLQVIGRADQVIVSGGENVAPEAVERALEQHPAVAAAGVLGVPDHEWGQRVVALVVPVDGSSPPSPAALRDHVGGLLGRWSAPREVHLVEAIPRTALGKVARADLADLAASIGTTGHSAALHEP